MAYNNPWIRPDPNINPVGGLAQAYPMEQRQQFRFPSPGAATESEFIPRDISMRYGGGLQSLGQNPSMYKGTPENLARERQKQNQQWEQAQQQANPSLATMSDPVQQAPEQDNLEKYMSMLGSSFKPQDPNSAKPFYDWLSDFGEGLMGSSGNDSFGVALGKGMGQTSKGKKSREALRRKQLTDAIGFEIQKEQLKTQSLSAEAAMLKAKNAPKPKAVSFINAKGEQKDEIPGTVEYQKKIDGSDWQLGKATAPSQDVINFTGVDENGRYFQRSFMKGSPGARRAMSEGSGLTVGSLKDIADGPKIPATQAEYTAAGGGKLTPGTVPFKTQMPNGKFTWSLDNMASELKDSEVSFWNRDTGKTATVLRGSDSYNSMATVGSGWTATNVDMNANNMGEVLADRLQAQKFSAERGRDLIRQGRETIQQYGSSFGTWGQFKRWGQSAVGVATDISKDVPFVAAIQKQMAGDLNLGSIDNTQGTAPEVAEWFNEDLSATGLIRNSLIYSYALAMKGSGGNRLNRQDIERAENALQQGGVFTAEADVLSAFNAAEKIFDSSIENFNSRIDKEKAKETKATAVTSGLPVWSIQGGKLVQEK